jgi:hypothetical protein
VVESVRPLLLQMLLEHTLPLHAGGGFCTHVWYFLLDGEGAPCTLLCVRTPSLAAVA